MSAALSTAIKKACVRCCAEKSLAEFYPRPIAYDGVTAACKDCLRAERRAYAQKNRERETAYTHRWREQNRERHDAYMKAWRAEHRDQVRETSRRWDMENAEHLAALKRAWLEENREAIMARRRADPERVREVNRRSALKHQERRTERQRQRRAAISGATVTQVDLDELWTGICGLCGEPMDRAILWPDPLSKSLDHIHPLSRGGHHTKENLQWAHLFCNISKGNRVDAEGGRSLWQ